jgi:hypothetical protein
MVSALDEGFQFHAVIAGLGKAFGSSNSESG